MYADYAAGSHRPGIGRTLLPVPGLSYWTNDTTVSGPTAEKPIVRPPVVSQLATALRTAAQLGAITW